MANKDDKIGSPKVIRALTFWHSVTSTALKQMPVDLSARQSAILLHVYLLQQPHSVKSLSEDLDISKPAICRALDVLESGKLLRRLRDRNDKRNVLLQRTAKGSVYLSEFAQLILNASRD